MSSHGTIKRPTRRQLFEAARNIKIKSLFKRFDKTHVELKELQRKYNYAFKSDKWKNIDKDVSAFTSSL
jgi:hypothetical protein